MVAERENAAAASTLSLSGFPSPVTAGTPGNATVTLKDAYGNLATGYTGTIHFTSSDSQAVLPAAYTFTAADAGVHTFTATLFRTQSILSPTVPSITATDTIAHVSSIASVNVRSIFKQSTGNCCR